MRDAPYARVCEVPEHGGVFAADIILTSKHARTGDEGTFFEREEKKVNAHTYTLIRTYYSAFIYLIHVLILVDS